MTPGSYPIHKATIMPRGQALGMVSQLPEHDVVSLSKKQITAMLDVLMGGRVAEVRSVWWVVARVRSWEGGLVGG